MLKAESFVQFTKIIIFQDFRDSKLWDFEVPWKKIQHESLHLCQSFKTECMYVYDDYKLYHQPCCLAVKKSERKSCPTWSFNLKSFSTGYILVGWKSWHLCNSATWWKKLRQGNPIPPLSYSGVAAAAALGVCLGHRAGADQLGVLCSIRGHPLTSPPCCAITHLSL